MLRLYAHEMGLTSVTAARCIPAEAITLAGGVNYTSHSGRIVGFV